MPGYGCRLRRRRLRLRQAVKGTLGASRCSCLGSVGLLSPRIRRDERGPSADEDEAVQARFVRDARRIDRLVEALTAGSEPMPSVGPALVGLDRERERLERDLAAAQARDVTPTGIEVIVHELGAALARLRDVLETGEPEER